MGGWEGGRVGTSECACRAPARNPLRVALTCVLTEMFGLTRAACASGPSSTQRTRMPMHEQPSNQDDEHTSKQHAMSQTRQRREWVCACGRVGGKLPHIVAKPAAFTLSTFQLARFWFKADAPLNVLAIVDTDATFHLLMSLLNVGLA